MYICKLIKRKVDDEPVEVWYLFRPTVINKTGDLSTENAKFLFFRRRSKELSLISLPINIEIMGKIIALSLLICVCKVATSFMTVPDRKSVV